jgi:hypothetical protein
MKETRHLTTLGVLSVHRESLAPIQNRPPGEVGAKFHSGMRRENHHRDEIDFSGNSFSLCFTINSTFQEIQGGTTGGNRLFGKFRFRDSGK